MSDEKIHVELIDIDKIKPYPDNAKIHTDEQVGKLADLIERFGWTQPIVVDGDMVIIAGHGRRLAAIKKGWAKVPVVIRTDLSPAAVRALRLSDNRVASQLFDEKLIAAEFERLREEEDGAQLGFASFTEKELEMFSEALEPELDESFFVEDIAEAVERQKEENDKKSTEIDESMAPVVDALGFKRVTINQSRRLRDLMDRVNTTTGMSGPESLLVFIERALA